jgi:L-gulono-1,4-lactone dehydrogenase
MKFKVQKIARRDLLKATATIGAVSMLPRVSRAKSKLNNWSGNILFEPKTVANPSSLAELQTLIKNSQSVKVVGSRHSFNSIATTTNTLINLEKIQPAIVLNRSNMTVELPASMKLKDANEQLEEQGVAFASIGEIAEQTIAGLIATGTHGTGLTWGTISDAVRAVKLITANGELVEINSGVELAAARLNLGALGAVVSVTMEVVPSHRLKRVQDFMPVDEAIDLEFIRSNDHVQIFYLPFVDKANVKILNKTTESSKGMFQKDFNERFKENFLLNMLLSRAASNPTSVPEKMKTMADQLKRVTDIGPSFHQMTSIRTMRYHEMELAIDLSHIKEALSEAKILIRELSERKENPFFAHMPVTLRSVKGVPDTLLSPTLGRDTIYFSFVAHTDFEGYQDYFKTVESRFTEKFNARPHWGKHYSINPLSKYSRADVFSSVRRQFDPNLKFSNAYLQKLF